MTTEMKKVWFVDGQIIEQEIPESEIYKQEPVAWMDVDGNVSDNNDHKCFPIPLYTTPPTAQPEQEPVASTCTHEWIDDTKNKPQWRCVKCGDNYRKEQA